MPTHFQVETPPPEDAPIGGEDPEAVENVEIDVDTGEIAVPEEEPPIDAAAVTAAAPSPLPQEPPIAELSAEVASPGGYPATIVQDNVGKPWQREQEGGDDESASLLATEHNQLGRKHPIFGGHKRILLL